MKKLGLFAGVLLSAVLLFSCDLFAGAGEEFVDTNLLPAEFEDGDYLKIPAGTNEDGSVNYYYYEIETYYSFGHYYDKDGNELGVSNYKAEHNELGCIGRVGNSNVSLYVLHDSATDTYWMSSVLYMPKKENSIGLYQDFFIYADGNKDRTLRFRSNGSLSMNYSNFIKGEWTADGSKISLWFTYKDIDSGEVIKEEYDGRLAANGILYLWLVPIEKVAKIGD